MISDKKNCSEFKVFSQNTECVYDYHLSSGLIMAGSVTTSGVSQDTYEDAKGSDFKAAHEDVECSFIVVNEHGSPTTTRKRQLKAAIEFYNKLLSDSQSTRKLFLIKNENDLENVSHLIKTEQHFKYLVTDHYQHYHENKKMYFMALHQV